MRRAAAAGLPLARVVAFEPSWYGVDPIHIRPSRWRSVTPRAGLRRRAGRRVWLG
jgi:hypothetical protein